jgi:hypothetical protein
MGLFDKLKSMSNMVLGNSAKVELLIDPTVQRGKAFKVVVTAHTKDSDIEIQRVYLRLLSTETVIITKTVQDGNHTRIKDEEKKHVLNDVYFDIIGAQSLKANQNYSWEKEITLPEHVLPTYNAYPKTHVWQVIAGLDMKGNDPDSGWKDLFVG